MMKESFNGDELLALFEAFSNPHRLKIISILTDGRQYRRSTCQGSRKEPSLALYASAKIRKCRNCKDGNGSLR